MPGLWPRSTVRMGGSIAGTMAAVVVIPLRHLDEKWSSGGKLGHALCLRHWRCPYLYLEADARHRCLGRLVVAQMR